MTSSRIPVGARRTSRKEGIITDPGPNHGLHAVIEIYEGHYSQGYKSNYERVETVWFRLAVDGQKTYTFRYSGKRLPVGRQQFVDCAEAIEEQV